MAGDYFQAENVIVLLKSSKEATNLITWLKSKTQILGLMHKAQKAMHQINVADVPYPILTLIHAVITRWTAHFLAFKQLLDLKRVLDHLIWNDEFLRPKDQRLTAGDSKACKKPKKNDCSHKEF